MFVGGRVGRDQKFKIRRIKKKNTNCPKAFGGQCSFWRPFWRPSISGELLNTLVQSRPFHPNQFLLLAIIGPLAFSVHPFTSSDQRWRANKYHKSGHYSGIFRCDKTQYPVDPHFAQSHVAEQELMMPPAMITVSWPSKKIRNRNAAFRQRPLHLVDLPWLRRRRPWRRARTVRRNAQRGATSRNWWKWCRSW